MLWGQLRKRLRIIFEIDYQKAEVDLKEPSTLVQKIPNEKQQVIYKNNYLYLLQISQDDVFIKNKQT